MKKILIPAMVLALSACSFTHPIGFSNEPYSGKKGESCQSGLFGLPFIGSETSIEEAKLNGNINKISSVEYRADEFILFGRYCTVVRGS